MQAMRGYLRTPGDIYAKSFRIAEAETDLSGIDQALHPLALRLVHAAGDPAIAGLVAATPAAVARGVAALGSGAPILTDSEMLAAGITRRVLPRENKVHCFLNDARVSGIAARHGTTRSSAAVDLWAGEMAGAVVAIGNAPTALFRLIELLDDGTPHPALVIAMPVGFVGAAESKAAFAACCHDIDHIAVTGRRGGSALAAAAVNALAIAASAPEARR